MKKIKAEHQNLIVEYKDKGMILNPGMIKRQGVDEAGIEKLKEIHLERLKLEDEMANTDDAVRLHVLAQEWEHIQFRLQKVWGFPEDSDYHRWWEVPKCVCPWMDNSDDHPTKYRTVRMDCPVHGQLPETNWFRKIMNYLKKKISISFQI